MIKNDNPVKGTETISGEWCLYFPPPIKNDNPVKGTETDLTSGFRDFTAKLIKNDNPVKGTETKLRSSDLQLTC